MVLSHDWHIRFLEVYESDMSINEKNWKTNQNILILHVVLCCALHFHLCLFHDHEVERDISTKELDIGASSGVGGGFKDHHRLD